MAGAREPSVVDQLKFIDFKTRKNSASLLFLGALMGLLGFVFAAFLGFHEIHIHSHEDAKRHQIYGHEYPSGNDYMPQSVSEMVHNPNSAVGKVFFGFTMTGAICMLMSWYPQSLQNVFVGDDALVCCWCGPSCVTARTLLPPVGMMLVACITAVPEPQARFNDVVSTNVHTFGAIVMIGGYVGLEIHALWPGRENIKIKKHERIVRWMTIVLCLSGAAVFQYCGAFIRNPGPADSCWDKWMVPNATDTGLDTPGATVWNKERESEGVMRLVDTAYGSCLKYKQANYIGECIAGVCMIANMLAIWYFCDERIVNLDEHAMLLMTQTDRSDDGEDEISASISLA